MTDLADRPQDWLEEGTLQWIADRYVERHNTYEPAEENVPIVAVAEYLNVSLSDDIDAACAAIRDTAEQYGRGSTRCRLRTNILWSMHNDDWPLLKTRFLIAVYAGVGQNKAHWLSRSRLAMLASGYSGKREWQRAGSPDLPTERQIRYWTEQLWMLSFFQLVLDGQKRIYSNKFAGDQELGEYWKTLRAAKKTRKTIHRI